MILTLEKMLITLKVDLFIPKTESYSNLQMGAVME